MKNLVLNVTLPIVGVVLLAIFGPASIGIPADAFATMWDVPEPVGVRFLWAACGVLVFVIGEALFLLRNRFAGTVAANLVGRIIQIVGFAIAIWALLSAMHWINRMASPQQTVMPVEMTAHLNFDKAILTVGLWLVALGQLVIGIGRLKGVSESERLSLGRQFGTFRTVGVLTLVALLLTLFAVIALFAFTSLFESAIREEFNLEWIEVSRLALNFQGLLVYPFLAYLLLIFYCLIDGIFFLVAKKTISGQEPSRALQA